MCSVPEKICCAGSGSNLLSSPDGGAQLTSNALRPRNAWDLDDDLSRTRIATKLHAAYSKLRQRPIVGPKGILRRLEGCAQHSTMNHGGIAYWSGSLAHSLCLVSNINHK